VYVGKISYQYLTRYDKKNMDLLVRSPASFPAG
jgi:hypothetical protein